MAPKTSPLAPAEPPALMPVEGVRLAVAASNTRYKDRPDLCLIELAPGTTLAGVFTRSLCPSAPVDWCKALLDGKGGAKARAILVNAGNANAFTGKAGVTAVKALAAATAAAVGCKARETFHASTGVIGVALPHEALAAFLPALAQDLEAGRWAEAARAIMTTDTYPKGASATAAIDGVTVTLSGIAKGSGMIAPDMATMLAFVTTDAALPGPVLQALLAKAADESFNAITVDGDTSTSDTLLLAATGRAKHAKIASAGDPKLRDFKRALSQVLTELALLVVKDGEGAEKLVTIDIAGAASKAAARRIGLAIANSPLVKTAIAGADANWGRIVMAVGKAGEKADRDRLSVSIGGVEVAAKGAVVPGYDETPVARHMKGRDIHIAVDVGVGTGKARVWTCDLTHGYIDINADYRS
ncbi:MAG TPA: bifunctional glutamate N-acetyltransferase/amino-acid acetyltransferase ArgJ [Kiloniellales bacterium]|nr:bifunctional glutamate N-acetyltransferase/amino-acid acetyltransferase ArgJ [Kiloniellales bacterium]